MPVCVKRELVLLKFDPNSKVNLIFLFFFCFASFPVCICRLYSDYLYFTENNDSSRDFDVKVQQGIEIFTTCIAQFSVRACVYNATLKESIEV